jgi:hypothetical protein
MPLKFGRKRAAATVEPDDSSAAECEIPVDVHEVSSLACDPAVESSLASEPRRTSRITLPLTSFKSAQVARDIAPISTQIEHSTKPVHRGRGRPPKNATKAAARVSPIAALECTRFSEGEESGLAELHAAAEEQKLHEEVDQTSQIPLEETRQTSLSVCPDILTKDNAVDLEFHQLLDFFGDDSAKGKKSTAGTLADPLEADLKVGDRVLILAPEEENHAMGQLCFRHEAIVKEIAAPSDIANKHCVKLKFAKWTNPKYDIWVDKRSWTIEHLTPGRRSECALFNRLYEKVKKYVHQHRVKSVSRDKSAKLEPVDAAEGALSRQSSVDSKRSGSRKKSSSAVTITVSKSSNSVISDSAVNSDDEPIFQSTGSKPIHEHTAASLLAKSVTVDSNSAEDVSRSDSNVKIRKHHAKKQRTKRKRFSEKPSSSGSAASNSSSSSSSGASDDSEYHSEDGTKRKKLKSRSRAANKPKKSDVEAKAARTKHLKPLITTNKESVNQMPTDTLKVAPVVDSSKAHVSSGLLSSKPQHNQRPVSAQSSKYVTSVTASSSTQLVARAPENSSKPVSAQTSVKNLLVGSAGSGATTGFGVSLAAPLKSSTPIKDLDSDLQQRWRDRLAAASDAKRELPPLPSFQPTSMPALPKLPVLPSLASLKPNVADVKPVTPKVAPPSPIYPYVRALFPPARFTLFSPIAPAMFVDPPFES